VDDDADGVPGPPPLVVAGQHQVRVGGTLSLSASNAENQREDTDFDWASDDTAIATVDANGTVTAVAAGETDIVVTGRQTGQVGRHVVVVTAEPSTGEAVVTLASDTGEVALLINETLELTATTVNGTDASYSFSSNNEDIATVSADGTVTALATGSVTITATGSDTGKTAAITLTVDTAISAFDSWRNSGHSDRKAEAFRHWDEDGEVPTSCARCHAAGGFKDYIGEDGSAVGTVDAAASIDTVIDCATCHNPTASELDFATFPSGVTLTGLGSEAMCMTCHQGRSSTDDVVEAVVAAAEVDISDIESNDELSAEEKREAIRERVGNDVDPDIVPTPTNTDDALGFLNIHYYAAGATLNAGRVRGGYQYSDKLYDWRFRHAPGYNTCVGCHDPHSLEVKVEECKTCHTDVESAADLKAIRMIDSKATDFDGDGDLDEGIALELDGLAAKLYAALQAYTTDKALGALCYAGASYPYFFKDTDASGDCSEGEAVFPNAYSDWTPRLLRAAYNYQVYSKDPGAFAHNAKYMIQLLFDSILDLNRAMAEANQIDMSSAERDDPPHFNGAGEAARHWDEDVEVSPSCSACHGGSEGFRFFLTYGVGLSGGEPDNGLDCATCHDNVGRAQEEGESPWKLVTVGSVELPNGLEVPNDDLPEGVSIADAEPNANLLCAVCHQGRNSGAAVDSAIARAQASDSKLARFVNVHYRAAFATALGSASGVGYEYAGKDYVGPMVWPSLHSSYDTCVECHDPANTNHSFDVADNLNNCTACHGELASPEDIVAIDDHKVDVDGDGKDPGKTGDDFETLHDELEGLSDQVLIAMYALAPVGKKICYGDGYPYFFVATSAGAALDGKCDAGDSSSYQFDVSNADEQKLLRAAYNYQLIHTEPGIWAHNFDYAWQLLYDTLVDLGRDVSALPKPPGR
jgi:hypothetical protein